MLARSALMACVPGALALYRANAKPKNEALNVRTAPVREPLLLPIFGGTGNSARIVDGAGPDTCEEVAPWNVPF